MYLLAKPGSTIVDDSVGVATTPAMAHDLAVPWLNYHFGNKWVYPSPIVTMSTQRAAVEAYRKEFIPLLEEQGDLRFETPNSGISGLVSTPVLRIYKIQSPDNLIAAIGGVIRAEHVPGDLKQHLLHVLKVYWYGQGVGERGF